MTIPAWWPVIGICGSSGSGKTTLVEDLIPRLRSRELAVAVVKHDAHGLTMDKPGKDSDRFHRAGATVVVHDPNQVVRRAHADGSDVLATAVGDLLRDHDVVMVEGHKETLLPLRIWLEDDEGRAPPPGAGEFTATLPRGSGRRDLAESLIGDHLAACVSARPLCAGILVGGRSLRMGRPKQLIRSDGKTWGARIHDALAPHVRDVYLLGDGPVAEPLTDLLRLPDAPGRAGPVAGMVAAMRWRPEAAWIFAACDMPLLDTGSVSWLLGHRAPGAWAVLPRRPDSGTPEPLYAWYDPRMGTVLEGCDRPIAVAGHDHTAVVDLPPDLADAWLGFNDPAQLVDRIEIEDGPV